MSEQQAVGVAAEREIEWIPGRNGGRLIKGGKASSGPRRATTAVRHALVEALRDKRGGSGKEFFVRLKTGNTEDRRTFANVVTKLIPVEVQGDLGEMLKITIVTMVAGPSGEPVPVPTQGTCVIGENGAIAPIAAPNESEPAVIESEQERA